MFIQNLGATSSEVERNIAGGCAPGQAKEGKRDTHKKTAVAENLEGSSSHFGVEGRASEFRHDVFSC